MWFVVKKFFLDTAYVLHENQCPNERKDMKKILTLCFAACMAAIAGDKITAFFAAPAQAPADLPSTELYPKGTMFPFGFYSFGGGSDNKRGELLSEEQRYADQDYILKNGCVSFIGPAYELNDSCVADAKRTKLKVVYSVHSKGVEGLALDGAELTFKELDKLEKEKKEPDWELLKAEVASIVKAVADNPEIAVWNLAPEELRPWKAMDMKVLQVTADTVRANDPLKRPLALYLPNHYGTAALKKFFPPLDISWRGMYVNYAGKKDSRVWARWAIMQQLEAIKDVPNAVCWALPEMFQTPKESADVAKIPAWVRHDVYSALVEGAKGVLVFSASRRGNFAECRKIYLDEYLKISQELNGEKALAQMYLFGERKDDLTFSVVEGPETLSCAHHNAKTEMPSLAIANIAWKNARYVTIVNSSNENVSVIMDGLPYGSDMGYENVFDAKPEFLVVAEGNTQIDLDPLEVRLLKVYCRE